MRVLVTGASGLLGSAVVREFAPRADVVPLSHRELDISDREALTSTFARTKPDVVINCAAYSGVDRAEEEAARALEVNAFGVLTLSRAVEEARARLVHYSTDFVFDGEADRPYVEADRTRPQSVYGASKLLGDWFALERPRSYVLRVESLFGEPGTPDGKVGSLGTILMRILAGQEVPVFVDRTVSPSYTADVARATRYVVERELAFGLYHCANSGAATWSEVAEECARLLAVQARLMPLTLETARLRARRPRYCALSSTKLAEAGFPMPHWRDALSRFLSTRS
jgi:dTDP-4-dehydrorhamnose reductase